VPRLKLATLFAFVTTSLVLAAPAHADITVGAVDDRPAGTADGGAAFFALMNDVGLQVQGINANPDIAVHPGLARFLKERSVWSERWPGFALMPPASGRLAGGGERRSSPPTPIGSISPS